MDSDADTAVDAVTDTRRCFCCCFYLASSSGTNCRAEIPMIVFFLFFVFFFCIFLEVTMDSLLLAAVIFMRAHHISLFAKLYADMYVCVANTIQYNTFMYAKI